MKTELVLRFWKNRTARLRSKFEFCGNIEFVFLVYVSVTIVATLHKYLLGNVNNYFIYKTAFFNLMKGADIYAGYPETRLDLYHYSPAFALMMGPIALLPDVLGLVIWNLLNVVPLFFAVNKLAIEQPKKVLVYWLIALELLTSIQNAQSNGLLTALILFAFGYFESGKGSWAAFFIALAVSLKLYAIIVMALFVFYSDKVKFVLALFLWLVVVAVLPVVSIDIAQLGLLYGSWLKLLALDSGFKGISAMGLLKSWFGANISNAYIQMFGMALFGLPLLRFRMFGEPIFRYAFLASTLTWMIIFNPRAESPTYIIALAGVAIWYSTQRYTLCNFALLALTLVLTSLSPTDIFPKYLRENFVAPYTLKALPVILVWLKIEYQLLVSQPGAPSCK